MKITLRFPTAAYAYAEVEVEGNSGAELEAKLADVQRAAGLAIQITGGGDSASIAERLLKDELGAVRMPEEQPGLSPASAPWEAPQAAPAAPWEAPVAPPQAQPQYAPPAPSPGPAPFGAPEEVYLIEVPRGGLDAWKVLRQQVQTTLPKDTIGWDPVAKRNTIKKSAPQAVLMDLHQRGYQLRPAQ